MNTEHRSRRTHHQIKASILNTKSKSKSKITKHFQTVYGNCCKADNRRYGRFKKSRYQRDLHVRINPHAVTDMDGLSCESCEEKEGGLEIQICYDCGSTHHWRVGCQLFIQTSRGRIICQDCSTLCHQANIKPGLCKQLFGQQDSLG